MRGDTDDDGLLDGLEVSYETDPLRNDTDNDGMDDGDELNYWLSRGFSEDDALSFLLTPDVDNDSVVDGK
jgi:hypothetical protein